MRRVALSFTAPAAAAVASANLNPYRRCYCDKADAKAADPAAPAAGEAIDSEAHHSLKKDLADAKEKIKDLTNDVTYAFAEAQNARRIGREDVEKARCFGVSSLAADMLDVTDTLDKAMESFDKLPVDIQNHKQVAAIATGVKMSQSVLAKHLSKNGVEKMAVKRGDIFNPNMHEALFKGAVADDCPADHITAIVKTGYNIKDRVLRAAQVGVADPEA